MLLLRGLSWACASGARVQVLLRPGGPPGGCYSSAAGPANIFDRRAKMRQKDRAALLPDAQKYDYLKDRVRKGAG
jgi:hypothetical protein